MLPYNYIFNQNQSLNIQHKLSCSCRIICAHKMPHQPLCINSEISAEVDLIEHSALLPQWEAGQARLADLLCHPSLPYGALNLQEFLLAGMCHHCTPAVTVPSAVSARLSQVCAAGRAGGCREGEGLSWAASTQPQHTGPA